MFVLERADHARNRDQLVGEVRSLYEQAQDLREVALQRKYEQVTAITKIPFALHGPLRRKVRSWLRRAELAVNDTTSIETLKPGPPLQFTCDRLLTWPMQPALVA
jgi:hypothetical protein